MYAVICSGCELRCPQAFFFSEGKRAILTDIGCPEYGITGLGLGGWVGALLSIGGRIILFGRIGARL